MMADQARGDQIDEKYGENRMKLFKTRCREILNDNPQRAQKNADLQGSSANSEIDDLMDDVAYDGDPIDIVTAYRQLKLDM